VEGKTNGERQRKRKNTAMRTRHQKENQTWTAYKKEKWVRSRFGGGRKKKKELRRGNPSEDKQIIWGWGGKHRKGVVTKVRKQIAGGGKRKTSTKNA